MPDSVSVERRKLVRHYGAEVILVHDAGGIGACVDECIQMALRMAEEDPHVYVPQQFANRKNLVAHRLGTAAEILLDIDGPVDGFCSGIGTGGTLTGVGLVLHHVNPACQVWAVEPDQAAILSGGKVGTHQQMGIGDGVVPEILDQSVIDRIVLVSDAEALEMARRLAREEGLMCGISSGTNVVAALRMAAELGEGKTVVTICPDTAERYISTELFSEE
jgi:cysteine synthase A